MHQILQDLRFGLRRLAGQPLFTALVLLTLALAVASTTTIFTMVNAVLLRPLPFAEPERVVLLWASRPEAGVERAPVSLPDVADYQQRGRSLTAAAVFRPSSFNLTGHDEPVNVTAYQVSGGFFPTVGVECVEGRAFRPEETRPGGPAVLILSHGFWQRHFGADPSAVGSSVELDGEPYVVVGVMSPRLEFGALAQVDVWVPLRTSPDTAPRSARGYLGLGRLAPGVSAERAQSELSGIATALAREYPESNEGWGVRVVPASEELAGEGTRQTLVLLALVVVLVLLVACANVGNLILVRAVARRREMAVRAAVGAQRGRLVRQLFVESALLAVAGGALGLLLTAGGLRLLGAATGGRIALFNEMKVDLHVLLFVLAVTLVTPLLFGLWPALRGARVDLHGALKEGGARSGGGAGEGGRRALVVVQVGLALVVIVVAALVLRTAFAFRTESPGFDPEHLLSFEIDLPKARYGEEGQLAGFYQRLERDLSALPGVESVALVSRRPIVGGAPERSFALERRPELTGDALPEALFVVATPGYFSTLGLPVLQGEAFSATTTAAATPVAAVDRAAVERFWPDRSPLGERIKIGGRDGDGPWLEIVAVVGNVRNSDVDAPPAAHLYVPFAQQPQRRMALVARTAGDPLALAATAKSAVWSADPDLPVGDLRTMRQILFDDLADSYAIAALFTVFAVVGLVLAVTGLYGVISYFVDCRRRELAVRMALGADRQRVRALVLRRSGVLLALGVAVGLLGALAASRFAGSLLYGVSATDPWTYLASAVVLALLGVLAVLVPALRATRLEPAVELRAE